MQYQWFDSISAPRSLPGYGYRFSAQIPDPQSPLRPAIPDKLHSCLVRNNMPDSIHKPVNFHRCIESQNSYHSELSEAFPPPFLHSVPASIAAACRNDGWHC